MTGGDSAVHRDCIRFVCRSVRDGLCERRDHGPAGGGGGGRSEPNGAGRRERARTTSQGGHQRRRLPQGLSSLVKIHILAGSDVLRAFVRLDMTVAGQYNVRVEAGRHLGAGGQTVPVESAGRRGRGSRVRHHLRRVQGASS